MKNIHILQENIYITSDEEIKEVDWYISFLENEVYKATKETQNIMSVANLVGSTSYKKTHFKIILTTDQDLIKDGVQAIDDELLEWVIKNPSCESVDVGKTIKLIDNYAKKDGDRWEVKYNIYIPKEEAKQEGYICPHTLLQCDDECCVSAEDCHIKESIGILSDKQETLEEAIEQYSEIYRCPATNKNEYCRHDIISAVKFGAKWQQERSYSEEEVYHILCEHTAFLFAGGKSTLTEWFEQFKNK
jgi:hypothetical protein